MNTDITNTFRSNFYIPEPNKQESTEAAIWNWYLNIKIELTILFQKDLLQDYYRSYYHEAGLLKWWRCSFFRHHFARTFAQASDYLLKCDHTPHILDLGCGSGTQSLWFAIMGAQVIAIDMDEKALSILRKRKRFYENLLDRKLKISIFQRDIFEFDFSSINPLDGIYSMFAFNMMQPSKKLIRLLSKQSSSGCRLAILDGNNRSWLARFVPSRRRDKCLSPSELKQELFQNAFTVIKQSPGFCLPPVLWAFLPTAFMRKIDFILGKYPLFAISYQTLAIKN